MKVTDRSLSEFGMKGEPQKARCPLRDNGVVKVLVSRSDQPSTISRMNTEIDTFNPDLR